MARLAAHAAGSRIRPEDVWGKLDQLSGQRGEPVDVPLAIPIVEEDALSLHIAQVAQALLEGREAGRETLWGAWFQHADPGDFPPRLRGDGERCRE